MPVSGTALLLIDVINNLAFEGSADFVAQAEPMARRLAALKRSDGAAGVPSIYINDNFGRVALGFSADGCALHLALSPGRRVSQRLRPDAATTSC